MRCFSYEVKKIRKHFRNNVTTTIAIWKGKFLKRTNSTVLFNANISSFKIFRCSSIRILLSTLNIRVLIILKAQRLEN